MYFLAKKQKFTANVVVGLLGNESPDSNRFTLVTPKSENDVRLQATLGNQNPTGLPVGAVRVMNHIQTPIESLKNEYSRAEKSAKRKDIIKDAQSRGEIKVREAMSNRGDAPYIILSNGALSKDAKEAAIDENEFLKERNGLLKIKDLICFEIHEDTARNQYVMVCIPPDKKHQMEQIITIPEDILENEDSTFRHRTGFMAAFKTLDAAKNVAEELYNEQIKIHEVLTTFKQAYDVDTSGTNISEYIIFDSDSNLLYENCQLYEICKGLKAGLDVSQFTVLNSEGKPVFDADQMYEIRRGLEAGIDVSFYTNPKFSHYQMKEIRQGLEKGLDVSVYAKLEYDDFKMREIRKSLDIGLPKEIIKQEIAKPELSDKEMEEIREKLDKELYELGKEGLLEKYGIIPEKENSEIEKDKLDKNENISDISEEISY